MSASSPGEQPSPDPSRLLRWRAADPVAREQAPAPGLQLTASAQRKSSARAPCWSQVAQSARPRPTDRIRSAPDPGMYMLQLLPSEITGSSPPRDSRHWLATSNLHLNYCRWESRPVTGSRPRPSATAQCSSPSFLLQWCSLKPAREPSLDVGAQWKALGSRSTQPIRAASLVILCSQ